MNAIEYLRDYPLSSEQQELVDLANRGAAVPLINMLSAAKKAMGKLSLDGNPYRVASRQGLQRYYEGQLRALISLIKDKQMRTTLERIYIGD